MTKHFKTVCRNCNATLGQCRCPSKDKTIEYVESCNHCPKKTSAKIKNVGEMVAFLQTQDQSLPLVFTDNEYGDCVVEEAELSTSDAPSPNVLNPKDYPVIRITGS